jgi:DnaD/phage-associated family protein
MSDIKFSLPGADIITLSASTADKLIRVGNGDAALLYLYILKTKGQGSSTQAAEALGKNRGEIADAMAVLSRLGLVNCIDPQDGTPASGQPESGEEKKPLHDQPRQYTASEISREKEKNPDFSVLIEETQRSLGKLLSGDELERLLGIYDGLRLPTEVILLLITHCIHESRSRSGGRMPSMRYIEKAAYTWEREGIFTLERAEEYLKALEVRKSARGKIKTALKIFDRELSESEKKYVDGWISMGFESDTVAIAYDITILQTNKLAWNYINKIMQSWHESGLHTAAQVMERENKRRGGSPGKTPAKPGGGDGGSKFGAANSKDLERMQRLLEKIKEE